MNQPYDASDGAFQMHEAKCPECGAPLQVPDNAEWLTCSFCGTSIHVSYPQQGGQPSGFEPDGTIRDRATGYGLFRTHGLKGWNVVGTALQRTGTSSRPYVPQVELRDRAGGVMSVSAGEAGAQRNAGMNALFGMYTGHLAGVDTANYADMPDPLALTDQVAGNAAARMGGTDFRFARQLACPDLEGRRQNGFAWIQRLAQSQGAMVASPFVGVVLRTYDMTCGGQPWKLAAFVEVVAAKDGMSAGVGEGIGAMMEGLGNLVGSVGGLFGGKGDDGSSGASANVPNPFGGQQDNAQQAQGGQGRGQSAMDFFMGGGLVGKMMRDRKAGGNPAQQAQPVQQPAQQAQPVQQSAQQAQPVEPTQQMQSSQSASWCIPDFAEYSRGGTVFWYVQTVATLAAPADDFDAQFERAFLPFVSTLQMHPDVDSLTIQVVQQEAARIQGSTQTQLAQNEAAFQAQQAAHRQQQAAFNSYNDSISAARDARHQQFMASSQQQFNHSGPDFSEAIRGVNTYTTSDGREVELSVHADHAWENQAGDVIGTSGGAEPGAGWTEIPRT